MFDNNCQACDTKHMETTTMDAKQIIDASTKQLGEFYTTTRETDGNAYQLYLDIADGSLMVNTEGSTNSWLQRDDGSLVLLTQHAYPAGTDPGEESEDGYSLWVDDIERMIAAKLAAAEGFSNDGYDSAIEVQS